MDKTISTAALQRLLGVGKPALTELAARGIVKRGEKRGTFELEASISGYCGHLRDMASARGGEHAVAVRAKLASAQADLAAEKVKAMRGEVAPIAEIEAKWTATCRAIRARVMAVADRMRLTGAMGGKLKAELRAALADLADGNA